MTGEADTLARLQKLVDFAWHNTNSSWYRDHCIRNGLAQCPVLGSVEDMNVLPPVKRGDLEARGLFERAFTEIGSANEIRSTSGTTGQSPLFYLRDVLYHALPARMYEDGARRKLAFWNYQLAASYVEGDRLAGLQTVVVDPHQLQRNVSLVDGLSIDTLLGTPSVLLMFGQMLKELRNNHKISFLDLQGEPCSYPTRQALQALYPEASFYSGFAVGEIGQEIGMRFPQCSCQDGDYYHVNSKDVIVEETGGELIVTRLQSPAILPLIRYATGDHISSLFSDECDCGHSGLSFRLIGRSNVDFVRVAGVEIRHEAISAIVARFSEELTDFVSAQLAECALDGRMVVEMQVFVVPKRSKATEPGFADRLVEVLLNELRVSATTMLRELVEAGLFKKPEIILLEKRPVSNKQSGIKLVKKTGRDTSH